MIWFIHPFNKIFDQYMTHYDNETLHRLKNQGAWNMISEAMVFRLCLPLLCWVRFLCTSDFCANITFLSPLYHNINSKCHPQSVSLHLGMWAKIQIKRRRKISIVWKQMVCIEIGHQQKPYPTPENICDDSSYLV